MTGKERHQRAKQRLTRHLPRVRFDIDENDDSATGITAISIVDNPAIESGFVAFGRQGTGKARYQRAKRRMAKILQRRR